VKSFQIIDAAADINDPDAVFNEQGNDIPCSGEIENNRTMPANGQFRGQVEQKVFNTSKREVANDVRDSQVMTH
jgi:hypothetical protein